MRIEASLGWLLRPMTLIILALVLQPTAWSGGCRDLNRSPDRLERLTDLPFLSPTAKQSLEAGPKAVESWERRRLSGKPVLVLAISSFNLDMKEVETIENYLHYEHRALWNILRARDPNVRVLFVSSDPVPKEAIDHLLESLPPEEAQSVRSRIDFLHVGDRRAIYLTDKIMASPLLQAQILLRGSNLIGERMNSQNSLLFPYNVTPEVVNMAKALGVEFVGLSPVLTELNTKSLNHDLFASTKVPHPKTFAHIKSERIMAASVWRLFKENPELERVFTKTNKGTSGQGIFDVSRKELYEAGYKEEMSRADALPIIIRVLRSKEQNDETWGEVMVRSRTDGAVVQEGVPHVRGPSAQLYIHSNGRVELLSTHMQKIEDKAYVGSSYPAYPKQPALQQKLESYALELAQTLARYGVRGRLAFDFFEVNLSGGRSADSKSQTDFVVGEANIREGGTTHSWEILHRLLETHHRPDLGTMVSGVTGKPVYYEMTDGYKTPWLLNKTSKEVLALFNRHPVWQRLRFQLETGEGIQLHMTEAIGEFGKVAYTASGTTPERAAALFKQMEAFLRSLRH